MDKERKKEKIQITVNFCVGEKITINIKNFRYVQHLENSNDFKLD